MNGHEINKIAAAGIGSLLVFLLLGFFSEKLFHTEKPHHGESQPLAFALIDPTMEAEEEVEVVEAEPVSLASLVASADPAAGAKVYNQCRACHKIQDGSNGVGPHLWNLVNREIGGIEGFRYSNALAGKEGPWDLVALDGWLENPQGWAPGTSMGYSGLSDPADRINVIAYINQESGSPVDLVDLVPAEAAEDDEDAALDTDTGVETAAVEDEAEDDTAE